MATSLRGRAMEVLVHPFSFREGLRHAGAEPEHPVRRLRPADHSALDRQLRSYLEVGGFPEAQGARTVAMHSASERQRLVNPRKAYPVDPGLIALFERSGRTHHGRALATAILLELERRGFEVAYVRTPEGCEVDFLAHRPGEPRPVRFW